MIERDPGYTWRGGFCLEVSPVPCVLIVFGAAGDLAGRKLFPALWNLYRRNLFHSRGRIVACVRADHTSAEFRELLKAVLPASAPPSVTADFLSRITCRSGAYDSADYFPCLEAHVRQVENEAGISGAGRVYYFATASSMYPGLASGLYGAGSLEEHDQAWRRVVLEKPFGMDSASALELETHLKQCLREEQIYRIDHYLGKETVQNILMFRFANLIFEPVWNRHFIDSVQITVSETVGVEHRAGYFDRAGLLRDMFQNHMLEMLSLVGMEIPAAFDASSIRDEKIKILRAVRPFESGHVSESVVRAQYTQGKIRDSDCSAYRDEPGVSAGSPTETFVAARLLIDNWRWRDVPFYLRCGKRLPVRCSEIVINFKRIPHSIFAPVKASGLTPNRLVLAVQPEEGLILTIQAKHPGPKLCMGALNMRFCYSELLEPGESMPDAYERLLLDCMLGDQTLFIRSDSIALSWNLLTPVLDAWAGHSSGGGELFYYPAGSWGPEAADSLLFRDGGRVWHVPE